MSEEQKKKIFDYIFGSANVPEHIMEEFSRWLVEHEGDEQTEYLMLKKWEEYSKTLFEGRDLAGLKKIRKNIRSRNICGRTRVLSMALGILIAFGAGLLVPMRHTGFVKEVTLVTGRGGIGEFTLPDGTKAHLGGESRLTYPEVFADNVRSVSLSGECFFEVRKDADRPFRLSMNSLEVEVLGTSFGAVSREDKGREEVILKNGSVKVSGKPLSESIILRPDQMLSYSSFDGKCNISPVNTSEAYKWYEEYLAFDNSRFGDILSNISRRFNIEVKPMTSVSMDKRMSLTITCESLNATMDLIASLLPIRYEIIGDTLIIRDKYHNP